MEEQIIDIWIKFLAPEKCLRILVLDDIKKNIDIFYNAEKYRKLN